MDLHALETFLTCARFENFTRASEELSYSQSTITAQIKALEADLGVPLFDRIGRGVSLTAAGHRLVGYARQLLDAAAEARAAVTFAGGHPTGDLTIAATETLSTYQLPPVLAAFQARYPDVRLFLRPRDPLGLVDQVIEGGVSAAITLDRTVSHPDLHVEALRDEPVLLLAPQGHPLTERARLRVGDLAGWRYLLSELDASYGGAFLSRLAAQGIRPHAPMEFASVAAIKQCVRTGMGLTVLPHFACMEEVASGDLVALPFDCPSVSVQLVWHRHRWVPPAAQALMDLTRDLLGTAIGPAGEEVAATHLRLPRTPGGEGTSA